jgi:hypothetical protein
MLMSAFVLGPGRGDAAQAPVELKIDDGDLNASCGGRPLLRYRRRVVEGPRGTDALLARSGYIHPVHAPCGSVVTNDFSPDHLHQRGVFSAWTKTGVTLDGEALHPDFWNLHQGSGRVRSDGVEVLAGGRPGFRAQHIFEARWRDQWEPVLDDAWEVRFPRQCVSDPSAPGAAHIFDITSRQKPRHALELPQYHYGGMAVRGSGQWAKGSDMTVLTSEGKDRAGADGARARWVAMSGAVDGKQAGIALLEHPANLRAPNAVRMHPEMPYFVFALPQSGPITLEAGREYLFRFRVVAFNGRARAALLDEMWNELADSQARASEQI